ncbi:hypothetical protein DRO59_03480 [Candidatus Bathyarchaeota archaeon]|nr:MAG: hypothetical protein DRO59_03480 [Candidatus Bathyarchaeota archaeon]
MVTNLLEIQKKTIPVNQYIASLKQPFREKFLMRKRTYQLKLKTIERLKKFADNYMIVAFSAEWCKDCATNIPVLALISEATGMEVRVFGGLKKDPLSYTEKWRIPPSPIEVKTFHVDKIPFVILSSKRGDEAGKIIENPREKPTLEEELLNIIEKHQKTL